jgi:hypothetical protein
LRHMSATSAEHRAVGDGRRPTADFVRCWAVQSFTRTRGPATRTKHRLVRGLPAVTMPGGHVLGYAQHTPADGLDVVDSGRLIAVATVPPRKVLGNGTLIDVGAGSCEGACRMKREVLDADASAEWDREAAYHLGRAAQESRLAAQAIAPEAREAHTTLAARHLALASVAEEVAEEVDAAPVHSSNLSEIRYILTSSFPKAQDEAPKRRDDQPDL